MRSARRAFTLVEVSVAALVLALFAVPLFGLLRTSSRSIAATDRRREVRFLVQEVWDRVEAADFLTLYNAFGEEPRAPGRLETGLWQPGKFVDGEWIPGSNPLLLTERLKATLEATGWTIRLRFRFLTREELGVEGENGFASESGVQHLQAGRATLEIDGAASGHHRTMRTLYCPLVLGRPGLTMSQCPATNEGLKRELRRRIP